MLSVCGERSICHARRNNGKAFRPSFYEFTLLIGQRLIGVVTLDGNSGGIPSAAVPIDILSDKSLLKATMMLCGSLSCVRGSHDQVLRINSSIINILRNVSILRSASVQTYTTSSGGFMMYGVRLTEFFGAPCLRTRPNILGTV